MTEGTASVRGTLFQKGFPPINTRKAPVNALHLSPQDSYLRRQPPVRLKAHLSRILHISQPDPVSSGGVSDMPMIAVTDLDGSSRLFSVAVSPILR